MGHLFTDNRTRNDRSVVRASESQHSFLNRAPGMFWERVRNLMESWLDAYPDDHRAGLIRRLKSTRASSHRGAWWELYLFSLFTALGARVAVVPASPTARRPDFFIDLNGMHFYLEATTTSGGVGESSPNEDRLIELINETPHPPYLAVEMRIVRDGSTGEQPRRSEVAEPIRCWLEDLGPLDRVPFHRAATQSFYARDWVFELTPFRLGQSRRSGPDPRLIHIGPAKGGAVRDSTALKSALATKTTRYADLDAPLVVAVALFASIGDLESVAEALYGSEVVRFPIDSPEDARTERSRDGLYMHSKGPQNTRIAGAMVGGDVRPWDLGRRLPDWWPHPWATTSLAIGSPFLTVRGTEDGQVIPPDLTQGTDPRLAFGLSSEWPGPEAAFEA